MAPVTLDGLNFRFIIEEDSDGSWTWRLFDAANHPIIQGPSGYKKPADCQLEIEKFQREVALATPPEPPGDKPLRKPSG